MHRLAHHALGTAAAYVQARPKLRYWCSVRWPVADALNRLDRTCWSDLVMWALGWDKPTRDTFTGDWCRRESLTHRECCYCGKFRNGQRYVDPERRLARLLDRLLGPRCGVERHRHLDAHQHLDHYGDVELTQHQEMGR